MTRGAQLASLVAALLVASCRGQDPATGIVVEVGSDLRIPAELDRVQILVRGTAQTLVFDRSYDLGAEPERRSLPLRVGLTPQGDGDGVVTVDVHGYAGAKEILSRGATIGFQAGRVVLLRMWLLGVCRPLVCGDPEQTCVEGLCETRRVDARKLPTYVPGSRLDATAGSPDGDTGGGRADGPRGDGGVPADAPALPSIDGGPADAFADLSGPSDLPAADLEPDRPPASGPDVPSDLPPAAAPDVPPDLPPDLPAVVGCGNGQPDLGEECDDGNKIDTDSCRNNCKRARCGDGVINTTYEQCDDGNVLDNDGCNYLCRISASVVTGSGFTCALKGGAITCWGQNNQGQATPPPGAFFQLAGGDFHACALRTSDGGAVCWGSNAFNQAMASPVRPFNWITAGGTHSCALYNEGGAPFCWGNNNDGQLSRPDQDFLLVTGGGFHTCGIRLDLSVLCWGGNSAGQRVPPSGAFIDLSAGHVHTCGIKQDGTLACWGDNTRQQLAAPAGGGFYQLSAGTFHTCAVKRDGTALCWGDNSSGQGNVPVGSYSQISAGGNHTCAVTRDGRVVCWGLNDQGQLSVPAGL